MLQAIVHTRPGWESDIEQNSAADIYGLLVRVRLLGRGILTELSLCYSTVCHYSKHNGTSSSYGSVDWIRFWSFELQ